MDAFRFSQRKTLKGAAVATSLTVLAAIALASTAQAAAPSVSGVTASWSSGKIRVAWTKTSNATAVRIEVFRNSSFAFKPTDVGQSILTTSVTASGKAGSKTVDIWPGTGAHSGNSSYVRITGIYGSSKSSPKVFRVKAPKPAVESGNSFIVKTATFNTMCAVQCDIKTTVGGVVKAIPESTWESRRTPLFNSIVRNPALAYTNSSGVVVQDKPDIIGVQELSENYPTTKTQLVDVRTELAESGYAMSNAVDRSKQNFDCQSAIKAGTLNAPAEWKGAGARVFYLSAAYRPVVANGAEVSGQFTIGCTAKLQQRATDYRTGVDKSAENTNLQRDAGYVLLQRTYEPGAGQVFLVISGHPTSNGNSPTTATALKEHNTDRAEARQQAGEEILARADALNLEYRDAYNKGEDIPVIVTSDLNSETKNSRDGRFKGPQQVLVNGGFIDARAYGDAVNGRFNSLNRYASTLKAAAYNDGGRIDYILGRDILGISRLQNMLTGYDVSSTTSDAVVESSLSDVFAAKLPSDHNMQYAVVSIGY